MPPSSTPGRRRPFGPVLLRDRPRLAQAMVAGVVPAVAGAVAGVLVGVSSGAYWAYGAFVAIGAVLSGFEHQDHWGGAGRGLVAGLIYGLALLVMHAIVGTHAKVSLGSVPALLAAVTAIAGMLLTAFGAGIARFQRKRRAAPAEAE